MSQPQSLEPSIPVLTEIIRQTASQQGNELDTLLAELQTTLASRTFNLADQILRSAFAQMEATLLEQVSSRLRRQLPELIDATLREHLETRSAPQGRT